MSFAQPLPIPSIGFEDRYHAQVNAPSQISNAVKAQADHVDIAPAPAIHRGGGLSLGVNLSDWKTMLQGTSCSSQGIFLEPLQVTTVDAQGQVNDYFLPVPTPQKAAPPPPKVEEIPENLVVEQVKPLLFNPEDLEGAVGSLSEQTFKNLLENNKSRKIHLINANPSKMHQD